jgi:hypothetical protein
MKVALFMILCSSVAGNCLEPVKINSYNTFYDCMSAGYEESFKKNKEVGPDDVNQYKMYIKFICANEEAEEI